MKTIYTSIAIFFIVLTTFAQTPEQMSYQAVIRDSADELVTNTQVGMQISILQGTSNGNAVYVETQTPTANANGLVSLEIGTGTTSDDFTSIDWATGPYFIKTETDPSGGTTYSITGTSQLMSVPYALYAKSAASVNETDPVYTQSEAANITASDITNLANLSGTNTGDQDLSGYLTAEADPAYTQSEAANITASDIANLGNLSGTNTGDQDLSGYLTAETDPAYTQSEAANITASDITNLGNLSGTNTGDQDLSGYLKAEADPAVTANFDLTSPTDGDLLQYDATVGKWIKRTVTGDVTIDNTGATIISDASVTTSKLADEVVTNAKIADNAVGTNKLQDANVTNAKLDKTNIPLSGFGAAQTDIDLGSNKILFANVYSSESDLPSASNYHGMFAHVHGTGKAYYAHAGNWVEIANKGELNLALVLTENNSANNQQIKNLADPTGDQDAATKAYVDNTTYTQAEVDNLIAELQSQIDDFHPPVNYDVTNSGSSAYTFNGGGFTNTSNPGLTLERGKTYTFTVNASGHPFYINTVNTTGTSNAYTNGVTNNGTSNGTITFTVPQNAPDTLYYNCQYHSSMNGTINIID